MQKYVHKYHLFMRVFIVEKSIWQSETTIQSVMEATCKNWIHRWSWVHKTQLYDAILPFFEALSRNQDCGSGLFLSGSGSCKLEFEEAEPDPAPSPD